MSKRQEIREKHRRSERMQRVWAILGIVALALVVVYLLIAQSLPRATGAIIDPPQIVRSQAKFNTMGNPNASVKIIEYADFQCPYCKEFKDSTEAQIIETYVNTGKVYYEYRSFGSFIGVESLRAAEAAYCAGDQEKFWEMHDILYTNQGAENSGALSDNRISDLAQHINLDMPKFRDCFTNEKYKTKALEDGNLATQDGVQSTPSFLINGTLIQGAQPFATFQQTIDAALAGK